MTGVTWRELPADAPEPEPGDIVRDQAGDWWVHGPLDPTVLESGHWHNVGGGLDSDTDQGACTTWAGVNDNAPLQLMERDDEYAPWPAPGEPATVEPSAYEIRLEAHRLAVDLHARAFARAMPETEVVRTLDAVAAAADRFEQRLRKASA